MGFVPDEPALLNGLGQIGTAETAESSRSLTSHAGPQDVGVGRLHHDVAHHQAVRRLTGCQTNDDPRPSSTMPTRTTLRTTSSRAALSAMRMANPARRREIA